MAENWIESRLSGGSRRTERLSGSIWRSKSRALSRSPGGLSCVRKDKGDRMSFRMFSVATVALSLLVGASALAAKDAEPSSHEGKIVSIIGDKLVMTGKDGQEHSHTVTADAKVCCDGKDCKSADLKPGMKIRVTLASDKPNTVNRIQALDKNLEFPVSNRHEGKVVSVIGNKLVMTGVEGSAEHTCTLAVDCKVTCDGKVCKASDLKPGMRIRVTSEGTDPHAATRIEAIDKNLNFASL
ncbi:MAG: hypothetical protein SFU86_17830 [Pirellulaceae bacterium]|nr:hypothetical protein [Pirellulaceae bacterium]